MTSVEEKYRAMEAEAEARRRIKARRQPMLLVGLVNTLVLGIGLTASVDLRRLATPGGTALKWTQAAVFGDCKDYLAYSVGDGTVPDERSSDELCRDLRGSTAQARADSITIGLELGRVLERPYGAEVEITLTRDKTPVQVAMKLVKVEGRWRVVRNAMTCSSVGCA